MNTQVQSMENPLLSEFAQRLFENLKLVLGERFPLLPHHGEPIRVEIPALPGELGERQQVLGVQGMAAVFRPRLGEEGSNTFARYLALELPPGQDGASRRLCFDIQWNQRELEGIFFQYEMNQRCGITQIWKFGDSSTGLESLRRETSQGMVDQLRIICEALELAGKGGALKA